MGKSTISMAIFNSKLLVITRGYDWMVYVFFTHINQILITINHY